jgi:hypothetical protein
MDQVSTNGQIEESIMDNGKMTRSRAKESLLGKMVKSTLEGT